MKKEILEGLPDKSLQEIISEVAEEQGLSFEEVQQIVDEFKFGVKVTKGKGKSKSNKAKDKAKKKLVKKSRKQNR